MAQSNYKKIQQQVKRISIISNECDLKYFFYYKIYEVKLSNLQKN